MIAPKKSRMAATESVCIVSANPVADIPSLSSTAACLVVTDSPDVNSRIMRFIAVAAFSLSMPFDVSTAPSTASVSVATPPISPRFPMRVTTSEICSSLDAVRFAR